MKLCPDHVQQLKDAITARGLGAFLERSGAQGIERLASIVNHGPARGNFEPIFAAQTMIFSRAVEAAGLAVLMDEDDGSQRCPVCFLIRNCQCALGDGCDYRNWIVRASNACLEEAKRVGLVGVA